MIIDGFKFDKLRPADLIDRYAVTVYVNGVEQWTELFSNLRYLAEAVSDLNTIIKSGDEILLRVQAPTQLKHITGKY